MNFVYHTEGTCSRQIQVEVENGVVKSVSFVGGCHGNLQGVSCLVAGMAVEEVVARLKGIRCGLKTTSCPDQLARALEAVGHS